jgi:hypothetical protein
MVTEQISIKFFSYFRMRGEVLIGISTWIGQLIYWPTLRLWFRLNITRKKIMFVYMLKNYSNVMIDELYPKNEILLHLQFKFKCNYCKEQMWRILLILLRAWSVLKTGKKTKKWSVLEFMTYTLRHDFFNRCKC